MTKIKGALLFITLTLMSAQINAQVKDSAGAKSSWMPKLHIPKLNFFKKDSASTKAVAIKKVVTIDHSIQDTSKHDFNVSMLKNGVKTFWKKTFVDFTNNNISLLAGLSVNKQNITTGNYSSNFSYDLANYNKDVYKPGYYGGFRVDGKYKAKNDYSFIVSLNKIVAGTNYKDGIGLKPLLGTYSKFKAEDQFFTISTAFHYKKLISFGDTSKRKFFIVAGPSIDMRLSGQSIDNSINNNYHRFLLRADLGVEFDNRSNYTLFMHYKHGLTSFTKAPITNNLSSFEIGAFIKATDLF